MVDAIPPRVARVRGIGLLTACIAVATGACTGQSELRPAPAPADNVADAPAAAQDPLDGLLARLGEDGSTSPDPIIDGLIAIGERAVAPLIVAAGDPDGHRACRAIEALGGIAAASPTVVPRVIPVLRDAFATQEFWRVSGAMSAVDALGPAARELVPVIAAFTRSPSEHRWLGFAALADIGEDAAPAIPDIVSGMGVGLDEEYAIRAVAAIGAAGIPFLRTPELHERHPIAWLRAVAALGRDADPLAQDARADLASADANLRAEAVATLGSISSPEELVGVVAQAARDPDLAVRRVAAALLCRLGGDDAMAAVVAALADPDPDIALSALRAVESVALPATRVAPAITAFTRTADARVRAAAARALGVLASGEHGGRGFTDRLDPPATLALRERAVAALLPLIDDADLAVRCEAAVALGLIGGGTPELRSRLLELAPTCGTWLWGVIGALQRLRLGPEQVPRLIELMMRPGHDEDRRALVMLASVVEPADPRVVEALIAMLADPDPMVRGYAASQLGEIGPTSLPAVEPLLALLDDDDRNTRFWAAHALGKLGPAVIPRLDAELEGRHPDLILEALSKAGPAAAPAIPRIVAALGSSDGTVREAALVAVKAIGPGAAAARPAVTALAGSTSERESTSAVLALCAIGLDADAADRLADGTTHADEWVDGPVLEALVPWPAQARRFITRRPEALTSDVADLLIGGWSPCPDELRSAILESPALPPKLMALSGEARFLPRVCDAMPAASPYERIRLTAFAVALGAPTDGAVVIDAAHPGTFKPASAWPGTDRRRLSRRANGHGDGFTEIMVSGSVRFEDGTIPRGFTATGLNDGMLMGQRVEVPQHCRFDPAIGRFMLFSSVFAAYAGGPDAEPGPYQTGSLKLRLDAPGASPLFITVYDEMPVVQITLTRAADPAP